MEKERSRVITYHDKKHDMHTAMETLRFSIDKVVQDADRIMASYRKFNYGRNGAEKAIW